VADGVSSDDPVEGWLRSGAVDDLLREVERCCGHRDWSRILWIRDRCRSAGEHGHQLWPVASWAEYRLALEGPAEVAATVLDGGFLALGPLSEVVAQHHDWAELEPHLEDGPIRAVVAHERVLRHDTELAGHPARNADIVGAGEESDGILLMLHPWEHAYALAEYRADGARFPAPTPTTEPTSALVGEVHPLAPDGDDGTEALTSTLRHWATQSSGQVRACCVDGTAGDAVTTLVASGYDILGRQNPGHGSGAVTPDTSLVTRGIEPGEAAALLAWAAASGAAQGRRRGAAAGRFDAWWTLAVLAGIDHLWPVDVGPDAGELRWWQWGPPIGDVGWWCRIAVEDPFDGLAWAIEAVDRSAETTPLGPIDA